MKAGSVIADRFRIERVAGEGGMGIVYRAEDVARGNEIVAVKLLLGSKGEDLERFQREAEVLAELDHSAIVRYVSHGRTESGELYLAMEWLEGESLAERVKRGPLDARAAVRLGERIADGLAFAHDRGILHRDLKPSNIFLPGGDIDACKIIDFGVARRRARELTMTGAAIGTPGYMAPEQARGEANVTSSADVFSLGCVLFKSLTGQPVFSGSDALAVLLKLVLEEAPRLSSLCPDAPPALDDLLAQMLSKRAQDRPQDGSAVRDALESLDVTPSRAFSVVRRGASITSDEQRFVAVAIARSELTDDLDATVSTRLEAGVVRAVEAAVAPHHGEMARLADGSIIVTFASNETALDLAARAARCALALRPILSGLPIAVAVGQARSVERIPVGEAIEKAVRALRPGDELRLDEHAIGLLDARFSILVDQHGPYLAEERDADTVRPLFGKKTPFVGRERELTQLLSIFDECIDEPVAKAVLVLGPLGVGKTRLRLEFVERLAAREKSDVTVWSATGDATAAGSPFVLLAPLLRSAVGITSTDTVEHAQAKLSSRVASIVAPADRPRVTHFLGELLGLSFSANDDVQLLAARADPRLLTDQMRRAWEDFVAAECALHPVALVLEDMHFGDWPSVNFIDGALRTLTEQPFFVLACGRNETLQAFTNVWSTRGVETMTLQPLTRKNSERLIRDALPSLEAPTLSRILERAEGNPYYLEELARACAAGQFDSLPSTLVAMAQARVTELSGEERRVLRAASVFGPVFWTAGVNRLLGGTTRGADLDDALTRLEAQDLVNRRATSRFASERCFGFRSEPIREAAYATLLPEDKALGHRLAADWLKEAGESNPLLLAEHLEKGRRVEEAGHFYREAAEVALRGGDISGAIERAEFAIRSKAVGEELGELRLIQAEAHSYRGDNADAQRRGLEAMALLPPATTYWFMAAAEVATASGRLADRDTLVRVAEDLFASHPLPSARRAAIVAMARATLHATLGVGVDFGERLLNRLSAYDLPANAPEVEGWVLRARATITQLRGDNGASAALTAASVTHFEAAGDLRSATIQRINVGYAEMLLGQYETAVSDLRAAMATAAQLGLENYVAVAKNNLGLALAYAGFPDEGRAVEEQAIAVFVTQKEKRLEVGSRIYLVMILLKLGELEAAEREARAAVAGCEANPLSLPCAMAALSSALRARGDATGALEASYEAKRLLDRSGGVEEGEAYIRLAHAEALAATGSLDAAQEIAFEAEGILRAQSEKLADPDTRASFLERVPENARLLEMAAQFRRANSRPIAT